MASDHHEHPTPSLSRQVVGRAIHEVTLTDALRRSSHRLLPPGQGRSVVTISEAAIGRGRPDVLFVVVSRTALNAYIASGHAVSTLTEARALATRAAAYTGKKSDEVTEVRTAGKPWTYAAVRQFSTSVVDSLAVEAKMKDWKQAIRQASRFRHLSHRAAIMLPNPRSLARAESYLQTYDLGFIALGPKRATLYVRAAKSDLQPSYRLWLLELAARRVRTKCLPPLETRRGHPRAHEVC